MTEKRPIGTKLECDNCGATVTQSAHAMCCHCVTVPWIKKRAQKGPA